MWDIKRKKGFSLAETVVFVIVTSILIAAITPIITRKIVNIKDAGSTLGGGQHGRIELFVKEKLVFNNDEKTSYEKVPNPQGLKVIVYERIDDKTYEEITNVSPEVDNNGKIIEPIIKATKTVNGKEEVYVRGYKYIFEDGQIDYTKVEYKKSNKKNDKGEYVWEKVTPGQDGTLISSMSPEHRVIESRLTKYKGKSSKNNKLFEAYGDSGKVVSQPWKKIYGGNDNVADEPLLSYTSDVEIPDNASNITIHAVGGGGAGGGLSESTGFKNSYQGVKASTAQELKNLAKKNVDKRIKKVEEFIAKETNVNKKHTLKIEKRRLEYLKNNISDIKISTDTANSTIAVEMDVQHGVAFPNDLLYWAQVVGSITQEEQNIPLKGWFNWETTKTGGISGSPFKLTVTGSGSRGGNGGSIIQSVEDYDSQVSCIKDQLVKNYTKSCKAGKTSTYNCWRYSDNTCLSSCSAYGYTNVDETNKECYRNKGTANEEKYTGYTCKKPKSFCKESQCTGAKCDTTYYDCSKCNSTIVNGESVKSKYTLAEGKTCDDSALGSDYSCKDVYSCATRKKVAFKQTYTGGKGGEGGGCAILSTVVTEPTKWGGSVCKNSGKNGSPSDTIVIKSYLSGFSEAVTVEDGDSGRSCFLLLEKSIPLSAVTLGGEGGKGARQAQSAYTDTTFVADGDYTIDPNGHIIDPNGNDLGKIDADSQVTCSTGGQPCASQTLQKKVDYPTEVTYQIEGGDEITLTGTMRVGNFESVAIDTAFLEKYTDIDTSGNYVVTTDAIDCYNIYGNDSDCPYVNSARKVFDMQVAKPTTSFSTKKINIVNAWVCKAETGTYDTRLDFAAGSLDGSPNTTNTAPCSKIETPKGAAKSSGGIKVYNELYTWETPYATKYLGYGEAGGAGEYKTNKISNAKKLTITLGKGGVWSADDYKNGKNGADGTATIVKSGLVTHIDAKGGKGGKGNLKTARYQLCYAETDGKCYDEYDNVVDHRKTTREIRTTQASKSAFESISALVKNSPIVGIGLGRSAEGITTISNDDRLFGERKAYVSSPNTKSVLPQESKRRVYFSNTTKPSGYKKDADYVVPSAMNFKGGDGAVIITW